MRYDVFRSSNHTEFGFYGLGADTTASLQRPPASLPTRNILPKSIMNLSPSSSALPDPLRQSAVLLPSFGVYDSSDILTPSDINHNDSPSPYGIVLVGYDEQDCEKILPLYYVSAKAAHQRSPASNPLNGGGVKAGWYTVAHPGMHYAVRYVSNNNLVKQKPLAKSHTDNCLRMTLTIDGRRVGAHILYFSRTIARNYGWDGFSRGMANSERGIVESVSQFQFAKLGASYSYRSHETSTVDPGKLGTITVDLTVGQAKLKESNSQYTNYDSYQDSTDSIGEKLIAKKGISLKTEAGRSKQICARPYCDFSDSGSLSELTVHIYVRERTWLQSRNILNGAGNACSCDDFVKSRSTQAPQTAPSTPIDLTSELIEFEKEEVKPIIKDEVDLTLG